MKIVSLLAGLLLASPALADGFRCVSKRHELALVVYNHTNPNVGTRRAAVMIASDLGVQPGRKTIAKFWSGETLVSSGPNYHAEVDLRYRDSRRRGELIAGTKLGYLKAIDLNVYFTYGRTVPAESLLHGWVNLSKRDGETISFPVACARYLKHPDRN